MLPYGAVRFKAVVKCSHLKWQRSVPMKCRSNFVSELEILLFNLGNDIGGHVR